MEIPGSSAGSAAPDGQAVPDVFVSYASQDMAIADAVVAALEHAGLKCWIAPRDVTPGEFYADAIVRALNAAPLLVLVLTENAVTSPHVLREVERTSAKRHPIISFRIGSVSLPPALEYFLSASHWLDAGASGIDSALPKLVEAVQRLLAPAAAADPPQARDSVKQAGDLFRRPAAGTTATQRPRRATIAIIAAIAVITSYLAMDKLRLSHQVHGETPAGAAAPPGAPATPVISTKSVAVLPFLDMSEKKGPGVFLRWPVRRAH